MPYPNEHSARLRKPGDFDAKTFRRTSGGTIYGTKKVPKTISIIWAKLKSKNKPKDNPIPQALRFPKKTWTAEKAKSWLKKNNIKYILFEPAKSKEKQAMYEKPATIKACVFNEKNTVTFAQGDGDEKGKFRIVGYSGGIIKNHWFWGTLAIDLDGCKFNKKRLPVLESHYSMGRLGFTTKQTMEGNIAVEGEFLKNANAQAMKEDIQQGFPMEASVLCVPSIVERVLDGASTKANGLTVKGPGTVFRKSVIREVSMCVFGMDQNTKSTSFDSDEKIEFHFIQETNIMAENEIESLTAFAEQYPELHAEAMEAGKAEGITQGEKSERTKFEALKTACGNDAELLVQCFEENKTVQEATKLCVEKLQKANSELTNTVTGLQNNNRVTPAVTEFTDGTPAPDETNAGGDGDKDEKALIAEFKASKDLQNEFGGDEKAYIAFSKANANGQVRGKLAS